MRATDHNWVIAVALVVVLTTQGCAVLASALSDPVRRVQVGTRVVEIAAGTGAAFGVHGLVCRAFIREIPADSWDPGSEPRLVAGCTRWWHHATAFTASVIAAAGAELVLYEFVLEPLRLAGAYWERGPAAGKTFRYP